MAVAVAVAPGPVFFLFFRRNLAEVAVRIAVGFISPTIVITNFLVIPHVVIGVVGIIDAIVVMMFAGESCQ